MASDARAGVSSPFMGKSPPPERNLADGVERPPPRDAAVPFNTRSRSCVMPPPFRGDASTTRSWPRATLCRWSMSAIGPAGFPSLAGHTLILQLRGSAR
jgi:hypothetical protein